MQSLLGNLQYEKNWGGFTTKITIIFYGKNIEIELNAESYKEEKDGLTAEQEQAFVHFDSHKKEHWQAIEKLLTPEGGEARFKPRTLLFNDDGSYALLCDDEEDPDDGVAVTLYPIQEVISQDYYL